jgi:nucleoside-diphosphate-sugar epimerase
MKASISLNEPEFDKNAFIRSYLETQKVYAAARAVQTPRVIAAASSYIDPADPLDKPPENTERPNRDYARARAEKDGSASVLLQPRAPAQPASHPPTKPARSTATAKLHDTVFNSSNRHQGVESSHQRSASPPAPPRKAQPRRNMENSDPEYTAREFYHTTYALQLIDL